MTYTTGGSEREPKDRFRLWGMWLWLYNSRIGMQQLARYTYGSARVPSSCESYGGVNFDELHY
jgi:hypothetical protein